jgi:hypothetical protein
MTWMMNTYETFGDDYWRYPEYQNEWAVRNFDRLSGPWGTYDAISCSNSTIYPDYSPFGSAYLNGTLLHDTVNAGFPFDDLFDKPPANGVGYSHGESKSTWRAVVIDCKRSLVSLPLTLLQSSTTRIRLGRCTRTTPWPTIMILVKGID